MKVICYGDSNTYGYDPRSFWGSRYPADCRWVDILAVKTGWEIQNNGMNGQEIPYRETMSLQSADLLIIMLGTNDLLQGNNAETVVKRMELFLNRLVLERDRIILIASPMKMGEWVTNHSLIDESVRLSYCYQACAERTGVRFVDAGEWNISMTFDGVHFSEEGHKAFAQGLFEYLNKEEYL